MRVTFLSSYIFLVVVIVLVDATVDELRHRRHQTPEEHERSIQLERIGFFAEDGGSSADHHVTVRQAVRNNRVTDSTRNPQQDLDQSSVARKAQRVQYVENKYRPTFTKCESASLKEGEPVNSLVTRVEARDNDTGPAGEIFYTIVRASNSEKQFDVDPVDGTVRSSKIFDRDEPFREKLAYVTVKASDKGSPPLEALCTFTVTIEDINDNSPMFDKSSYEESVPRDAEPGKGSVMRIAATDIDFGENAHISYSLRTDNPDDEGFFIIDQKTGVITLKKPLTKNENYRFSLRATATDNGTEPRSSDVRVIIKVASSTIKPPSFTHFPTDRVTIPENYTAYKTEIASFEAQSNIAEPDLYFELVKGLNQQTNSDETFKIFEAGNRADILVNKALDFETVSHYTLTVRVKNSAGVASETILEVDITDVNDISPAFIDVDQGSVLENSPPGTFVLKIQATDRDGTFPNNWVRYDLHDFKDLFSIDANSGEIRTLKELDREQRRSYPLTVIAYDGNESALTLDGKPNEVRKRFQIEVADVNDNPPYFPQGEYDVEVAENADIGAKIAEIGALDKDTDAQLFYEITGGNVDDVFDIDPSTGFLKVRKALDYETRKSYVLTIEAFDGKHKSSTKVNVKVLNVNDNPPRFRNSNPVEIRGITEERTYSSPIVVVQADDPDYDPETSKEPMKISFFLNGESADSFNINDRGELTIVKPLDRDKPRGAKEWYVFVVAQDELDGKSLQASLEVKITLEDINDNAPYIDTSQPIVWYENQGPATITTLNIIDNDEPQNGAPFRVSMADTADPEVKSSFRIKPASPNWELEALISFDREERKEYLIPVVISDSGNPSQTGTSTLTVIIGDRNDNSMSDGSSSVFVYNYKGALPDTVIGRAYVNDADDWDLPDKDFTAVDVPLQYFAVSRDGGYITMKRGCPAGIHSLKIHVHDRVRNEDAEATVRVQVKEIPEEAVIKSGSLRIKNMTKESFITPSKGSDSSPKDRLKEAISTYVGAKPENVDVFTVVDGNNSVVDVRFSAHGSPYYDPVKLNGLLAANELDLLNLLSGAEIAMFGINECLELVSRCEGSCTNRLEVSDTPYTVFTNTSSFVGVEARVVADCTCKADSYLPSAFSCEPGSCLNGGTCTGNPDKPCQCRAGFDGPRCEGLYASFPGTGWAWYDPIPTCYAGSLTLTIASATGNGLIFYAGPAGVPLDTSVRDFVAMELHEGYPVAYVDLGSGTQRLELFMKSKSLADSKAHDLELSWQPGKIQMRIDGCPTSEPWCMITAEPKGDRKYFNAMGPLQVGGVSTRLDKVGDSLGWDAVPRDFGFSGCIQNVTFNKMYYDLSNPGHSKNHTASCEIALPIATQGASIPLIIGLIVLFLLLLIVIILVAVYRRKRSHETLKEINDDIRENIINYSDEGGGEGDMTAYDLSVLRMTSDGKPLMGDDYGKLKENEKNQRRMAPGENPDISAFLGDNKGRVDRDPDGLPFDELRHYAYEGEGNSNGSLSSLASGTDDGDLNFECLSDFGPRFKKLADMYGDNTSDESSSDGGGDEDRGAGAADNESWC